MAVDQAGMTVSMRVRLTRRVVWGVVVLMMLVVMVDVLVLHRFVGMLVLVAFTQQ